MNIPQIPEHLYEEALLKFAEPKTPFQQWASATAIVLMKQYPEQPEGLTVDVMGCKMRITLEEINA